MISPCPPLPWSHFSSSFPPVRLSALTAIATSSVRKIGKVQNNKNTQVRAQIERFYYCYCVIFSFTAATKVPSSHSVVINWEQFITKWGWIIYQLCSFTCRLYDVGYLKCSRRPSPPMRIMIFFSKWTSPGVALNAFGWHLNEISEHSSNNIDFFERIFWKVA